MIEEIARQLSAQLAAAFDATMADCLNVCLGRKDWTLDELRGRLHELRRRGKDRSHYYCDDKLLLVVGDLETVVAEGRATASRKIYWRITETHV